MPVPRLIAAFLTDGYYVDHVGTLSFSSRTAAAGEEGAHLAASANAGAAAAAPAVASAQREGAGEGECTEVNSDSTAAPEEGPSPSTAAAGGSPPALPSQLTAAAIRHASFAILSALRDLSDEAQLAVLALPANTLQLMNSATRDMGVSAIRATVPKRYLPLYGSAVTPAPLDSYIHQIITLLRTTEEEIVIALVLMAKVATRIPVCSLSVARVFLTACVVASKMRADERTPMRAYATLGGVEVGDMLAMERSFLTALGYNAGVRPESFADMVYSLRQYCVILASEGVDWIAGVWADFAPRIATPDLRHLDATPSPDPLAALIAATRPKAKSKEKAIVAAGEASSSSSDGRTAVASSSGGDVHHTIHHSSSRTTAAAASSSASVADKAAAREEKEKERAARAERRKAREEAKEKEREREREHAAKAHESSSAALSSLAESTASVPGPKSLGGVGGAATEQSLSSSGLIPPTYQQGPPAYQNPPKYSQAPSQQQKQQAATAGPSYQHQQHNQQQQQQQQQQQAIPFAPAPGVGPAVNVNKANAGAGGAASTASAAPALSSFHSSAAATATASNAPNHTIGNTSQWSDADLQAVSAAAQHLSHQLQKHQQQLQQQQLQQQAYGGAAPFAAYSPFAGHAPMPMGGIADPTANALLAAGALPPHHAGRLPFVPAHAMPMGGPFAPASFMPTAAGGAGASSASAMGCAPGSGLGLSVGGLSSWEGTAQGGLSLSSAAPSHANGQRVGSSAGSHGHIGVGMGAGAGGASASGSAGAMGGSTRVLVGTYAGIGDGAGGRAPAIGGHGHGQQFSVAGLQPHAFGHPFLGHQPQPQQLQGGGFSMFQQFDHRQAAVGMGASAVPFAGGAAFPQGASQAPFGGAVGYHQ